MAIIHLLQRFAARPPKWTGEPHALSFSEGCLRPASFPQVSGKGKHQTSLKKDFFITVSKELSKAIFKKSN